MSKPRELTACGRGYSRKALSYAHETGFIGNGKGQRWP